MRMKKAGVSAGLFCSSKRVDDDQRWTMTFAPTLARV
ncbi:hypothetical protein MBUL_00265 [Methylobacterium bullatum]|uniref:Uncharacterized protein n=1 Tax=Methylobacterium bullatum TaxID=570505 RepID=A0A679J019_9HYPH|nr:hypothetical protein MBUL_00265 [Methylobacterium bullatum]